LQGKKLAYRNDFSIWTECNFTHRQPHCRLPVDARLGKMLVFGSIFQCLDKVLTITAALSSKSPFELSIHQAVDVKAQHRVFQDPDSDFASLCNFVEAYGAARSKSSKAARLFCRNHCLNHSALRDISALRKDFLDLLCGIGFVSEKDRASFLSNAWLKTTVNQNGRNWKIVHAIVCAGLWPHVAALKQSKSGSLSLLHNGHELFFHRSSVNAFKKHPAMAGNFVCYFERFGTATQESVSTTCFVNAIPVILFGGVVVVRHTERKVTIDGWMEIDMSAQTGVLLQRLRRQMDDLLQNLLENSKQSLGGDSIVCSVADILL
jgi:HrpA-like RNA helicase